MRRIVWIVLATGILTACTASPEPTQTLATNPTGTQPVSAATLEPGPTVPASTPTMEHPTVTVVVQADFFTESGITLPAPTCSALTQAQTEGPYYTPNTPESHSLLEEGMPGTRFILVGYVVDQGCNPLPNAWLDFWQADANGEYDHVGYRLRGHQFTDAQGRFHLETILPGLYSSRPIEHIHVKVRPDGGEEVTSQLYFPDRPMEGLTVTLEERDDYLVGYFNFVVQR